MQLYNLFSEINHSHKNKYNLFCFVLWSSIYRVPKMGWMWLQLWGSTLMVSESPVCISGVEVFLLSTCWDFTQWKIGLESVLLQELKENKKHKIKGRRMRSVDINLKLYLWNTISLISFKNKHLNMCKIQKGNNPARAHTCEWHECIMIEGPVM